MKIEVWDDMAREADGLHDPVGSLPDRIHDRLRLKVLAWAQELPLGSRVLDLGCGRGKLALLLAQERPDLRVIGMDFSQGMLDVAAKAAPDKKNPVWLQGDALSWPLPDKSLDAVLALDLSPHIAPGAEMGALLKEAERACGKWLLLEIKTPWVLKSLLSIRSAMHAFAPARRLASFFFGLRDGQGRIVIHIHDPSRAFAGRRVARRIGPWPLLPSPSKIHVLDLSQPRAGEQP